MILVSIKVPIQKSLQTYLNSGINKSAHTKKYGNLFNVSGINKSAHTKKYGKLYNDPPINKIPPQKSLETYLIILVSKCAHTKKVWKLI